MNDIYEGPGTTNRRNWKFDAAGRMSDWYETLPEAGNYVRDEGAIITFDGDGRSVKRLNRVRSRLNNTDPGWVEEPEYTLFSSVTGQKITTLTETGLKNQTFVYMGGSVIAEQWVGGTSDSTIVFKQSDPITGSERQTEVSGELSTNGAGRSDIGALGTAVPSSEPETFPMPNYKQGGSIGNPEQGCKLDGHAMDCNKLFGMIPFLNIDYIDDLSRGGAGSNVRIYRHIKHTPGKWVDNAGHESEHQNQVSTDGDTIWVYSDTTWIPGETTVSYSYENGKAAPLNDEENKNLDTRIEKLINDKLNKKNCKDFLISKLGEDGYNKLIETLRNRHFRYSAERSTEITVEEAGLYGANARQNLTYLSDKKNTKDRAKREEYKRKLEYLDWSVSKWSNRIGIHAVLGNINGNPVIFYNSFKKITTILHENLHISTGLGDVDLANKLGLKNENGKSFVSGSEVDTFNASRAISQALIDNGCTD